MADRVGELLGNYRLARHLGKGGFADVYLGEHRYLKSYAALKVLHVAPTKEEERLFLTEAQTLAQMDHPHSVRILDFAVEHETPFLVMEYVPGGTVRNLYPAETQLPLATVVSYIKQVASALQLAHDHSIIHRDVKPENILLRTEQHVLLSDFGLALFAPAPDLLSTQAGVGTIFYMAPEQLLGKPQFATDQYALGVVAYEWLCGVRPFTGKAWNQIAFKHYSEIPRPLRESRPDLPETIEAVVLKALAKEPQQRYPSVQQFALALENAFQEQQIAREDTQIIPAFKTGRTPVNKAPSGQSFPTVRPVEQVFLSAPSADLAPAFARQLKSDLDRRGVIFANDYAYNAIPGPGAENPVRQAMRAAHLVLVVVTPATRSSQMVREHLRLAAMYQRRIVFVWAFGSDTSIDPALFNVPGQDGVIDARGSRYVKALDEVIDCLNETSQEDISITKTPTRVLAEPRNPYKGLHAFTGDDAWDFFGRDRLINDLAGQLQTLTMDPPHMPGSRLLALVGPSGSGKSSLMKAGLLPRLQGNMLAALPGSERWLYLDPITPGRQPCAELLGALARLFPEGSLNSIREELAEESGRGLHRLAAYLNRQRGAHVLLAIDQFEEIFHPAISETERQHFLNLLTTAATEPGGPVLIVLTLRADFYDRPMQYPEISYLIEAHHVPILPLELADLRAVIEEPAALPDVQLSFEGNLVGDLLFEAQGQAGFLPLLEFTLDQLFQQRDGHWLTLVAYKNLKGVQGALARHAEDVYNNQLPDQEHREMARTLFLRLIDPGTGVQDATRRRAALAELVQSNARQTALINTVANIFVEQRLLMVDQHNGANTIEVSHEALISHWPRLATWLSEARADILLQHTITADSAEWWKHGQSADHLYRGNKLIEAQAWAVRNIPNQDEEAFLRAGAEEHARREAETRRRQRRIITALSIFSLVVIVLGSLAGIGYLVANQQTAIASQQTTLALKAARQSESRELALEANTAAKENKIDLALLLGTKAIQVENTYEARSALFAALMQSPHLAAILNNGYTASNQSGPLLWLAFGQGNRVLYTYDGSRFLRWDVRKDTSTPFPLPVQENPGSPDSLALSPDKQTLGVANVNGVWLVDLQTGTARTLAPAITGIPADLKIGSAIAFNQAGTLVAASRCHSYPPFSANQSAPPCTESGISVWNTQSGQSAFSSTEPGDITGLALNPDGTQLATAGPTGIQVVNRTTGLLTALPLNNTVVESLIFSPDGKELAAGSDDKTIHLWDTTSWKSPAFAPLTGHGDSVFSLAFSPDSKLLASASGDGRVILWDTGTGQQLTQMKGHRDKVLSVTFSDDSRTLASGGGDGSLLLWDARAEGTINQRLLDAAGSHGPLCSPDGQTIFVGTDHGQILLLDTDTGKLRTTLGAVSSSAIESIALSANGTILVAGRSDGAILLWDLPAKKVLPAAPLKYPGALSQSSRILLSADGHLLAAEGDSGEVLLWDINRPGAPTSFHVKKAAGPGVVLALSNDGRFLAIGNCPTLQDSNCPVSEVLVWTIGTGKPPVSLPGNLQGPALDLDFSPDGHTLAGSGSDGIKLWDVTKHTLITTFTLTVDQSAQYYETLQFSADSSQLLSSSASGDATFAFALWNVHQRELLVQPFAEPVQQQGGITFSPDNQHLASVFVRDGTNIVLWWDITPEAWQKNACTIAHRNLTQSEWSQFLKEEPQRDKICADFPLNP